MTTQTDPNAAYNAKLLEIAEILARTPYNPEKWQGIEHFGQMVKERLIEAKMEEARAMVAKMAKWYEEGFFSSLDDSLGLMNEEHTMYVYYNELCIEKMQERGLIPNTKNDDDA